MLKLNRLKFPSVDVAGGATRTVEVRSTRVFKPSGLVFEEHADLFVVGLFFNNRLETMGPEMPAVMFGPESVDVAVLTLPTITPKDLVRLTVRNASREPRRLSAMLIERVIG